MTELTVAELERSAGRDLGAGPWVRVDQRRIDLFADATDDHQWIHVDRERAAAGPFGGTVAHGYLTLSLLPALLHGLVTVTDAHLGVNYGIERVRFTAPVPSGSEVRLKARLGGSERRGEGLLYRVEVEVELRGSDGSERPALVGEVLYMVYAEDG
jgi:acyl dehydratase